MKQNFIRDETGEGYIDLGITLLIIIAFMASMMALFPIFTARQSLNQTAKFITRTIELHGKADNQTIDEIFDDNTLLEPDDIDINATWENASLKTIQLKQHFSVVIIKRVPITIMRPLGNPVVIYVDISAKVKGVSEVYWK